MVDKTQFTQLFYFVSSLLSEKIGDTVDGWEEYVKTDMLKDDKKYNQLDLNLNSKNLAQNTEIDDENECRSEESFQCTSDGFKSNSTITWLDLFNTVSDWKVIGFGICGLVKYANIKVNKIKKHFKNIPIVLSY